MNIWMILLFLIGGFGIGFFEFLPRAFYRWTDSLTRAGLIFLLICMGAKIGIDDRVLSKLDTIGWQALLLALSSVIFSIIFVLVVVNIYKLKASPDIKGKDKIDNKENNGGHSMTLVIILSVILGIIIGFLFLPKDYLNQLDMLTTYALALLLFGVGIDIGLNKESLYGIKKLGWKIILLPVSVAVGSIIGAVLMGIILGLKGQEAAAVGAGFGWYSLSGIIISQLHSVQLGSMAFLSNVIRELITIILLPIVVKYLGALTAIAPGGATTMDVTLPLIKETAGEETVIPAFINGAVLSALVPILVPLLLKL